MRNKLKQLNTLACRTSTLDWTTNPTMILVETTDYPVEKIPFPTVTICQKDNDPNKLILLEKILNHVKYACYQDYE